MPIAIEIAKPDTSHDGFPAVDVRESPEKPGPVTSTLGLLFFTGILLAASLYGAAIYAVNPVRDFAGPASFPAVRSDYRSEKAALFEAFAQSGPVDGLILGSSRSMLLNGERLRELSGGHLRFFNFGLASAKAEDFLAALRFTLRSGQRPKIVLIGVDVESLRDSRAHGDAIHPLRELATGRPDPLAGARVILERTATASYALDAARSIFLRLSPRPPAVGFGPDGTLQYRARDARRQAGTFRFDAEAAGCAANSRKKIEDTRALSGAQIRYLRLTVEESRQAGAEAVLWLTGPHPRTAEHMAAGTAYPQLLAGTWELLRRLEPDARAVDLHDPALYGGPAGGWYDCNHFDNSHARLIERILLDKAGEGRRP
jgi:hypothetical protein